MRSFCLEEFPEDETVEVRLLSPFSGGAMAVGDKLKSMEEWADAHTEAPYLILLGSVLFKLESDALIFKLKYGC